MFAANMAPGAASRSLFVHMACAFMGFTLWTMGDAVIRYLRDYPPVQMAFLAAISSLLFLAVLSPFLGGVRPTFQKPRLKLQILRGFFLAIGTFFSFVTFANLDLAKAYTIIFISPFLVKILSVVLTGEKISPRSWLVTLTGFLGVLIVLRPGFVPLGLGAAAACALALFFSLGHIMVRYIGSENQTPLSMALFKYMFLLAGCAYPALAHFVPMKPFDFFFIAFMGFESAVGTVLVSHALAKAPAAYIAPIHYTQILWGMVWGALFFHEYPDHWTLAGGAVIVASGLLLVYLGRRARPVSRAV